MIRMSHLTLSNVALTHQTKKEWSSSKYQTILQLADFPLDHISPVNPCKKVKHSEKYKNGENLSCLKKINVSLILQRQSQIFTKSTATSMWLYWYFSWVRLRVLYTLMWCLLMRCKWRIFMGLSYDRCRFWLWLGLSQDWCLRCRLITLWITLGWKLLWSWTECS